MLLGSIRKQNAFLYLVPSITLLLSTKISNDDASTSPFAYAEDQTLTNWSATHSVSPRRIYEPERSQEVMMILKDHHEKNVKLRPVGTALSPNGIGMTNDGMDLICLSNMDDISIDKERMEVTVGAGARVSQVLEALAKENMTLENFSSIQEQQMGGWTQVAAHGTGCSLSTVEEQIVRMKIATPCNGLLTLSKEMDPWIFKWAKVGLGCLGIVTELTLKVIPSMNLTEKTYSCNYNDLKTNHTSRLKDYRHCRYMWIPHTEDTVVVVSNPSTISGDNVVTVKSSDENEKDATPTKPLKDLLVKMQVERKIKSKNNVNNMSFSQLRDALLDMAPLDPDHIKQVNKAEAEFWRQMGGVREADSTEILGFDCGGQQWVLEVCFPIGSMESLTQQEAQGKVTKDIEYVKRALKIIESGGIAAPAPIEQRWTSASTSPMSPAYSSDPNAIFSWVGVIMYLPPGQDATSRKNITDSFNNYIAALQPLMDEFGAKTHWAKIELPGTEKDRDIMRQRLKTLYQIDEFRKIKQALDPKAILNNNLMDEILK